ILKYHHKPTSNHFNSSKNLPVINPSLPPINSTSYAANLTKMFRSLANSRFPANVPKIVIRSFSFGRFRTNPCPKNQTCQGPTNTTKFAAAINNGTFILPNTTSLLQSYFSGMSKKVSQPISQVPLFSHLITRACHKTTQWSPGGTKVVVLKYNTTGTSILGIEAHPIHLHGYNFYVVKASVILTRPVTQTLTRLNETLLMSLPVVGLPSDSSLITLVCGFMHCHIEIHFDWGLTMAWVVLDGDLPNQKLPPPLGFPYMLTLTNPTPIPLPHFSLCRLIFL
ncbi:LOW QUALITY PROTEIN: hypothetical protein HID58_092837, partial [Brassica napus]